MISYHCSVQQWFTSRAKPTGSKQHMEIRTDKKDNRSRWIWRYHWHAPLGKGKRGGCRRSQYCSRASRSESDTCADEVAAQSTRHGYSLINWSQTLRFTRTYTTHITAEALTINKKLHSHFVLQFKMKLYKIFQMLYWW